MSVKKLKPVPGPKLPKVFYAGQRGYALESTGRYIPLPCEGQVRAHLLRAGADEKVLMDILCQIREDNYVSYIGPVAGFRPGQHKSEDSGENFLVTVGPTIIKGEAGNFPFLDKFLHELVDDPRQPEQFVNLVSWMKQARYNMVEGVRRPLPALVLCGPVNGGKSLFVELMKRVLGGRAASAMSMLGGSTPFAGDTIGAELLYCDDENASRDHRMRTAFAHGIKRHFFNGAVRVEAKYRESVTLRPIQCLVVAVNDESESLRVLPPLDESLSDKITLVKCDRASLDGLDDRGEINRRITGEIPALIAWLESYTIPAAHRDQRTGVGVWQHPRILRLVAEGSPEETLRELLGQCSTIALALGETGEWKGTASELQGLLFADSRTRDVARGLLSYTKACGEYLAKLEKSGRVEVSRRRVKGLTVWRIKG